MRCSFASEVNFLGQTSMEIKLSLSFFLLKRCIVYILKLQRKNCPCDVCEKNIKRIPRKIVQYIRDFTSSDGFTKLRICFILSNLAHEIFDYYSELAYVACKCSEMHSEYQFIFNKCQMYF